MVKRFLLLFVVVVFYQVAEAQYRAPRSSSNSSSNGSWEDRIYFGGGGGLSGGFQFLSVSLSPLVGYKVTEKFSAGLQLTYQYTRLGQSSWGYLGGGPFAIYSVSEKLFAYTQYEYLRRQIDDGAGTNIGTVNFNSLFAGLGYSEPIGGNLAFQILVLYNFLYVEGNNSPYQSPLEFRLGIVAGF